jgi:DNA-binding XRE family transcriptional regulator
MKPLTGKEMCRALEAELARRAGIRPETLNRIEQGRNKPSVPTIAKIDRTLRRAAAAGSSGD